MGYLWAEARRRLAAAVECRFQPAGLGTWSGLVWSGDSVDCSRLTYGGRAGGWTQLTAVELQVAQLAARGLSNREIGERLYLSHRTVAAHLYQIFPKLGVGSCTELPGVLPEG